MKKPNKAIFFITFSLLIVLVFGLVMFHQLKHGDFPAHIEFARQFSEDGYLYKIPHTLLARFVTIVRALLPANFLVWVSVLAKQVFDIKEYEISTLIVMVLSYLALGWILIKYLIESWELNKKRTLWFAGIGALVIMISAPIFIFTFPKRMFLGYIMGNRYDSPTFILFKPFALVVFMSLVKNTINKWDWKESLIMALAIWGATLAKPSLTITLIPAIGILLLFKIKEWKKTNWFYLVGPFGLVAFLVLIVQFIIGFVGDRGDRIIFDPFTEILIHVPNLWMVLLFIIMSIVFPIFISIVYWKKIKNDFGFQLAWINFFVALAYGLLLAEQINMGVNNFWNSCMIAVFVLFFVTVSFWGREIFNNLRSPDKFTLKDGLVSKWIPALLLGLHFVCGIIYYVAILFSSSVNVN